MSRPIRRNQNAGQRRRRRCYFTEHGIDNIDYKDIKLLKNFVSDSGKIISRRFTASKAKYQRALSLAIRRARFLGLMPYFDKHSQEHRD